MKFLTKLDRARGAQNLKNNLFCFTMCKAIQILRCRIPLCKKAIRNRKCKLENSASHSMTFYKATTTTCIKSKTQPGETGVKGEIN